MEKNTIFVGSKPVMNYVLAVVTQFNEGSDGVVLRARGKAISRAVDAAEIVRNRFVPGSIVKDIQISTEEIENYNNEKTNVSIIEIFIEKGE
jgi:DNA-binding protein